MASKQQVQDAFVYHQVGLQNLSSGIIEKLQGHLKVVQDDIAAQLDMDLEWGMKSPERLREVRATIAELQREAHKALRKDLTNDLTDVAQHEIEWSHKFYSEVGGVSLSMRMPSASQLRSLVTSKPFEGRILNDWARKMERNQIERINQQIMVGMTQGEGPREIVDRLKGTRALKYRDGQFAKDQRSAEALVRTASNHVANQGHLQISRDHPKEFKRYRFSAVLDARTTWICRDYAGTIHVVDEGPIPPLHWGCRSTIVFISAFNTWEKEEPAYADWLARQDKSAVVDALGKKRAQLYLEGNLKVDKFTNGNGQAWTLKQLQSREKKAWEKTFGK